MSRASAEDALQLWLVNATGYPGARCIWANQTATRPETDFATLQLSTAVSLGAYDATVELQDLTRPAGTEIERRVTGWRELHLMVHVYASAPNGASCAHAVLTHAMLALNFESVSNSLTAQGIGMFDLGAVLDMPVVSGSKYQSHAVVEARCYFQDTASEFTGYIATVEPPTPTFSGAVVDDLP